MNYKRLSYLLLTSPLLLHANEPCVSTHDLNHVSIRHIESKGLGYTDGYTTLEGFFVPLSALNTRWVPFLDVRGHIFNNSKPAANTGVGLRYIESRVWGGNVYYDYRKTRERNYNQVSFGFESLGRYLDYRINGYFPVGKHKGSLSDATFAHFSGNSLYLSRKQELALKGTNAEVGVHIAKVKGIDFYSALGPYYFANDTKHTFGGEFRIGMDVLNILRIEGNTSYDHLFKWIGQGQISLSYAFTPKKMSRKEKKGSCSFHGLVRDRAFQRVDKQEIIVVTTQKKKSVAINPATGLPYTFWFVDNTSHSAGTYESPFNTLLDAHNHSGPNDIIAVLPGDGTDKGMNAGIILQNGQKLWGMSVVHALPTTLGTIKIKPLATTMPTLSNSGDSVVTGANNNDIVGLKIVSGENSVGILLNQAGKFNIENNIIFCRSNFGVYLHNISTNTNIANNTFTGTTGTTGIALLGCSGNCTISNNFLTGMSYGITIGYINKLLDCSVVGNKIDFVPSASQINTAGISCNVGDWIELTCNSARIYNSGVRLSFDTLLANTRVLISDNQINNLNLAQNQSPSGILIQLNGNLSATLRNNQSTTPDLVGAPAYLFQNLGGATKSQINFTPDNIGNAKYTGF